SGRRHRRRHRHLHRDWRNRLHPLQGRGSGHRRCWSYLRLHHQRPDQHRRRCRHGPACWRTGTRHRNVAVPPDRHRRRRRT
ncbi:hypothetical protein LTR94_037545, partial [Friedmanniomyces endolithicus]